MISLIYLHPVLVSYILQLTQLNGHFKTLSDNIFCNFTYKGLDYKGLIAGCIKGPELQ